MLSFVPRIVYSRHYDIGLLGLERLHPFDSRKYGRAYNALKAEFGSALAHFIVRPTRAVNRQDLLIFHTPRYLDQLKGRLYLASALEVQQLRRVHGRLIDWCVLRHMRWGTMGTMVAAREAMHTGLAVNLSGGYHHASAERGEGFCIYSDIALAIHDRRAAGALAARDTVLYIDLDAHQGNGVCRAFFDDSRVFIFDMFNQRIYPSFDVKARRRIDCPVPLERGCGDADYLSALRSKLPQFVDGIARTSHVALAIYNAGTDIYTGDQLGGLNVSENGVLERDRFVIDLLAERRIPTVMLLSGGHSRASYKLVANAVSYLLHKYGNRVH